jgi:hypothetical protein
MRPLMALPASRPLAFYLRFLDSPEAWVRVDMHSECETADLKAALGLAEPEDWCLYTGDGLVCLEDLGACSRLQASFMSYPCTPEWPWWVLPRAPGPGPSLTAEREARERVRAAMRPRLPMDVSPPGVVLAVFEAEGAEAGPGGVGGAAGRSSGVSLAGSFSGFLCMKKL